MFIVAVTYQIRPYFDHFICQFIFTMDLSYVENFHLRIEKLYETLEQARFAGKLFLEDMADIGFICD